MRKFLCESLHNPPFSYGDCIAACVRTLTGIEEVPHFFKGGDIEKSWQDLRFFLRGQGFNLALFTISEKENPFEYMKENNEGIPYLLLCQTKGGNHAVNGLNDKVFNDPAWYRDDNYQPLPEFGWVIGVITKHD